jgi:hypothetical protein
MGGSFSMQGDMRNAYNILVGKPEWKKLLGNPNIKWKYNIKMHL